MVRQVTLPTAVHLQLFGLHVLLLALVVEVRSPGESGFSVLLGIFGSLIGVIGLFGGAGRSEQQRETAEHR